MVFHAIYNGLALLITHVSQQIMADQANPVWNWLFTSDAEFHLWVLALSAVGTISILWWLHRLPYQRSKEEQLQEVREQQFAGA